MSSRPGDATRIFELGVYDETDDETVCVLELLASDASCAWYDDDSSVLIVRDGDVEQLREEWNLGPLSRVAEQLEHVQQRLDAGQSAILRSAVMDENVVPWVLFTPAQDTTAVSVFFVTDPSLTRQFPDRPGADALYTHVLDADDRPEQQPRGAVRTERLLGDLVLSVCEAGVFLKRVRAHQA